MIPLARAALVFLVLCSSPVYAQMAEDDRLYAPDGLPDTDAFGVSNGISANGWTALAVSRGFGAVAFHRLDNGEWETHELVPSIPMNSSDPTWVALSEDGRTALLGARYTGVHTREHPGAVIVFRHTGGGWQEDGVLVGSGADNGARFGDLVAVTPDGSYAVVGATWENRYEADHVGAVYVFQRSAQGEWEEVGRLVREGARPSELGRGLAVSADAGTIIASYWEPRAMRDRGSYAVVYEREGGSTEWTPTAVLSNDPPNLGYGSALDLSAAGDLLALSDYDDNEVSIFRREGGTEWVEETVLTGAGPYGTGFGSDLSLMPGREAVVVLDPTEREAGAAFVFEHRSGAWVEVAELLPSDPAGPYGLYNTLASVSAAHDWVVAGRGIDVLYLYDLSGVLTAAEAPPVADGQGRLSPPRPNPFAHAAQVTLRLDRPERVEAVVYDALGRVTARPFNGVAPAGETVISIDGSPLAPGLYLLRVSGEGWQEARSVVRTGR
jgi:hypothetical protein